MKIFSQIKRIATLEIRLSRKQKVILFLFLFFLLALGVLGYFWWVAKLKSEEKPPPESPPPQIVEEEKYPCGLAGQWISSEEKTRRLPIAVAIENHPQARPQSGLLEADLVYEALTEGGITRFLAFYVCGEPSEIGPIRSARSYFLDWLSEYKALYVHCGGSPESLRLLSYYGILDLDQFFNAQYFWRVSFRVSPHNLYSNSAKLRQAVSDKNYPKESNYSSFKFKDEAELSDRPSKQEIIIYYSNPQFIVRYLYNPQENTYKRFQGGFPFKDRKGKQIAPKNVVIIWTETWREDWYGRLGMKVEGQGKALFFQDGKVIVGIWKKPSRISRTKFYNKKGEEISFNRGQIWIQVVPLETKVSY